ncbi:MAG: S41 family peptidase [Rhodospirillales bacterium]
MRARTLVTATAVVALASALALAEDKSAKNEKAKNAETYELLDLFGDVFERVRSDYVEETTDEQLIEAAVNGMLTALDPHSGYMNAKRFDDMKVQTQGQFGGLGLEVTMDGGIVKVISPIDDTPAYAAGLHPGDLITHIDGEQVQGMQLPEAVDKMRGAVGSTVRLTIRRGAEEPFDVTLTRAVIKIKSVRSRLDGKVGIIRISSFSEQTEAGVTDAVQKLKAEAKGPLQGLVLDLRNNPGGLLAQAVAVSDAFLERGEIVSTRSRKPDESQRYNARAGDIAGGIPIVILINGGSASAAEIVAGALQDQHRAILLGTRSFGKGSVQTIIPLAGHGAMRLTTARYYTPSGRSIQAVGIDPDIVVEQARIETMEAARQRREADLPGALRHEDGAPANPAAPGASPQTSPSPAPSSTPSPSSSPVPPSSVPSDDDEGAEAAGTKSDYQLLRALDLVRGLALFQERTAATGN